METVTSLISMLDKPALLNWSNKIGLKGIKLHEYSKKVKDKGNDIHYKVENFLKNGVDFEGSEKLKESLLGYDVIGVEKNISNGMITGRIDFILKKEGLIFICDLKSSNKIYLQTKLQLATYKHLYGADKICYVNSKDFKIEEIKIDTKKYYEVVKRLYQIKLKLNELNEKL